MKIKEFLVVRDKEQHPKLKEKNIVEWKSDFLDYNNIVNFLNTNFYMNILNEEYVYVLSFNLKMELLGVFQLSHGNFEESKICMRELGIFLLLTGAEKFVVAHNHPNGTCEISAADFEVTNKMRELSDLLGINIMQHFIIGADSYDFSIEVEEYCEEKEDENYLPFG